MLIEMLIIINIIFIKKLQMNGAKRAINARVIKSAIRALRLEFGNAKQLYKEEYRK